MSAASLVGAADLVIRANNNLVPIADIPALVFPALLDTLIMVGIVMAIVVLVGIPLGALVHNLAPGGLFENPALHQTLIEMLADEAEADDADAHGDTLTARHGACNKLSV